MYMRAATTVLGHIHIFPIAELLQPYWVASVFCCRYFFRNCHWYS